MNSKVRETHFMLLRYTENIAGTPHLVLKMNLYFPPGEKQNNALFTLRPSMFLFKCRNSFKP